MRLDIKWPNSPEIANVIGIKVFCAECMGMHRGPLYGLHKNITIGKCELHKQGI